VQHGFRRAVLEKPYWVEELKPLTDSITSSRLRDGTAAQANSCRDPGHHKMDFSRG